MDQQKLYGIADAAHQAGCSQGTLRKLDEEGVVRPTRDPWGRRLFSRHDIDAAKSYMQRRKAPGTLHVAHRGALLA
jgi:DNA-binding transcriptional MerR regulator